MALRPSIIDRLTAEADRTEFSPERGMSLADLRRTVRRDLEWLLNSNATLQSKLADLKEAKASLLSYGIPDLAPFSQSSPSDSRAISEAITETIKTFEPRFVKRTIKVTFVPRDKDALDDFRMRFRIDAVLHVEPVRERVMFDTHLEPQTFSISVEG